MKLWSILLCLILLFCSCSCKNPKEAELGYSKGAFICEFAYTLDEVKVRATLEMDKASENGSRDMKLYFCEPSALSGISVVKADGVIKMTLDTIETDGSAAESFAEITELFECEGEIVSSKLQQHGSETLDVIGLIRPDGRELTVFLDPRNDLPTRIRGTLWGESVEIHIISFEKRGE